MEERVKGVVFLLLGAFLTFMGFNYEPSPTMSSRERIFAGVLAWIFAIVGLYLVLWKGLVKIIKGK